jgi:hypothetical protein
MQVCTCIFCLHKNRQQGTFEDICNLILVLLKTFCLHTWPNSPVRDHPIQFADLGTNMHIIHSFSFVFVGLIHSKSNVW